jgi:hypothetical protein
VVTNGYSVDSSPQISAQLVIARCGIPNGYAMSRKNLKPLGEGPKNESIKARNKLQPIANRQAAVDLYQAILQAAQSIRKRKQQVADTIADQIKEQPHNAERK